MQNLANEGEWEGNAEGDVRKGENSFADGHLKCKNYHGRHGIHRMNSSSVASVYSVSNGIGYETSSTLRLMKLVRSAPVSMFCDNSARSKACLASLIFCSSPSALSSFCTIV